MPFAYLRRAAIALALLASAGCTVKDTEAPSLSGPSGLALSLRVNAIPDSISQDGGSQSSVRVTAIGPDGKGISALPLRLDMFVNGVPQDYGTLSSRSVVTNSDGVATAVYTSPPSPINGVFGTCSGLPGNCVSIVATATATNFSTANPEQALIRLVPIGVILPPAGVPTAQFTISPTPVNFNIASIFDASASTPGSGASAITSYAWTFGDGSSASGKVVTHTFVASTSPGNAYNVTLTVTNDRSLTATVTQSVAVDASPAPSGDWVFSPAPALVGETIFFNADGVKPAAGHKLVQFSWNFGDGSSGSGFQTTHVFTAAAAYTVVLSVLDDAGQKVVLPKTITVGTGNPLASFTSSVQGAPALHTMFFDGGASTGANGATIVSYQWAFGDGGTATGQTTTHTYAAAASFTVRLTVTDSLGRVGTSSAAVTVP
jgi:PKD repeat protein